MFQASSTLLSKAFHAGLLCFPSYRGCYENTLGYPRDQKINKKNHNIVVYNIDT